MMTRGWRTVVSYSVAFAATCWTCSNAFVPPRFRVTPGDTSGVAAPNHYFATKSSSRKNLPLDMAADDDDDDWHPMDPAYTTPQLLAALWHIIAQGSSMVKGESMTVVFPRMIEQFSPSYLSRLMAHLDSCKDVCDYFGSKTVLVPYHDKLGQVTGFTIKSYRNPDQEGEDDYDFAYDPFWDDGVDFDYTGVDDEYDDDDVTEKRKEFAEIENKVPDDDDEIMDITKVWVGKMMSDMGICPFTSGSDMAGMPMGKVFYCVDRGSKFEDMYCRYWNEVVRVEQTDEKEVSTTLLIAPEFCMDNVEQFENFANTLTQPLAALQVEDLLQLVFFHPHWTFRDGSARSGVDAAANYARRSPWPMINILRTKQVRAAQKGIPTGLVYKQNEKTLDKLGTDKLETMLRSRNWDDIDIKVNRKDMEALRIAMDLKETGQVAPEDQDVIHDVTPAANKVSDDQVDGSNMVNVVLQALEKRLGKTPDSASERALTGPETSAAIMASDFLLNTLDDVAKGKSLSPPEKEKKPEPQPISPETAALLEEEELRAIEEEETSVLFGGKGIIMDDDDEDPDLDPRDFY